MRLLAGGCSFIWGSELSDDRPGAYSHKTWPALYAQENSWQYDCVAQPGASNTTIARRVIDRVEQQRPDLVIVQWTFPGRYEFRYSEPIDSSHYYSFTPWSMVESWQEIFDDPERYPFNRDAENSQAFQTHLSQMIDKLKSTPVPEFARFWFKRMQSLDNERYYFFREVHYLKCYLESKSIPYAFSSADTNTLRNTTRSTDPTVNTLMDHMDSIPWVTFDYHGAPMGFMDWARASRQAIGSTHPLDSAHANALDLTRTKLDEIFKDIR